MKRMNLSPQITVDREVAPDLDAPLKISAQGVNVFYGDRKSVV